MPEKIVIVAGEESGDLHAANLVRQLFAWDSSLQITGIGGKHLQEAGVELVSDLARFGVTGFSEVIRHARVIRKAFVNIKLHLQATRPKLLILVDYPGFNLRLAKFARTLPDLRIVYYISPQIWAWKAKRIETIRSSVDKMAVILPFEKILYQKAGIPVSFVGHPLTRQLPHFQDLKRSGKQQGLPWNKKIIAILPGSRKNEIIKHMPVLVKTITNLLALQDNLHFVLPIAKTLDPDLVKSYFSNTENITFFNGKALEAAACSDCIVVASGTASLECALLEKPMCIIYKVSLLSYVIAKKLIKIKYLGLCNLLENKMIVPELLQQDFNPRELTRMVLELLNDQELRDRMVCSLEKVKLSLSASQADSSIAELVKKEIMEDANIHHQGA